MGSNGDSGPLSWDTLPNEIKALIYVRGFGGCPAIALRAANEACQLEVDAATRSLVACLEPSDHLATRSSISSTWPSEAANSFHSILTRLPGLVHLDLRCFPGLRPIPAWPISHLLRSLPESVTEVRLPRMIFQNESELSDVKKALRFVPSWSCEISSSAIDGDDEEDPLLLPGAVLLATSTMWGTFREAVIMLLGPTEFGGWFGVVVNGPSQKAELPHVRWGGPISNAPSKLWKIQILSGEEFEAQPVICGDARLLELSVGDTYVGDDWRASLVESAFFGSVNQQICFQGYAGWACGQLEDEMRAGDWKLMYCPATLLFKEADVYGSLAASIRPPEKALTLDLYA